MAFIYIYIYSLNACHLDLPLLEFWSWQPLCSNNSGLRLFAKKRLQQKQRSRHASASFKWGISRIQPAKMLLGPPCAWPDQCRENGRAYRDGWRDGSCNVLHCSTRAFFGPWMGWCVVLALITWHFNCDSTWIVKPWSTRLGALANDVSSRGLPQGRCCRCCPPCLCRRTFCLFCPRLPTQSSFAWKLD